MIASVQSDEGRTTMEARYSDRRLYSVPLISAKLDVTSNRIARALVVLQFLALLIVSSAGCGGSPKPDCGVAIALAVAPPTATADHAAAPPGNKIQFVALDAIPPGCRPTPGPAVPRQDLKWTVSEPANVTIGNTPNVDYGLATCNNATAGTVTVTASGP